MNGGIAVAVLTFAMSSYVVGNAYMQKQQFYPTVVHLTKSNSYMAVLYLQAFVLAVVLFKVFRWIFFGQLRLEETEHLVERLWYAIPDTCLAFTFFSQDFSPQFVAMFTILFIIKAFHWLGEDRIDFMDRSPNVNFLFHLRALSIVFFLGTIDVFISYKALSSVLNQGPSVQVVFSFEYAILATMVCTIFIKYVLHSIDLAFDHPWENKTVYMLYSDLVLEFIRVMLYYTLIYFFLVKVHTPPLFAFRPSYQSFMRMYKCIRDILQSRRAIMNLNALPDATAEQLANQDNVCIVCRDEMRADLATCKVLPCSHIFHVSCLRRWFQRQQTCPTCRKSGLTNVAAPPAAAAGQPPHAAGQAAPGAAPAAAAPHPAQPFPGMGPPPMFPMWPPVFPPPHAAAAAGGVPPDPAAPAQAATGAASSGASDSSAQPAAPIPPFPFPGAAGAPMMFPPFFPPPPPFMPGMPGMPGMPAPPLPDFSQLSNQQLSDLEGTERKNVEARIEVLRNIQKLLDAAVQQMEVYYTTAGQNSLPHVPATPVSQGAPHASSTASSSNTTSSAARAVEDVGSVTAATAECCGPESDPADARSPEEIRQRRLDYLRSVSQLSDASTDSATATMVPELESVVPLQESAVPGQDQAARHRTGRSNEEDN